MRVHPIPVCLLLAGLSAPAFPEGLADPLIEDEETLSEDFIEDRDPLDLNAATAEDLASLPGVSRADAERIVAFRAARGPFRRPRDLALVDGLPRPVVEALLPHLTVNRGNPSRGVTSRARFVRRSASPGGRSLLTGSSLHSRATLRAGDRVSASMTTDKDAGEGSPLDFAAGYAEVRPAPASRLVLGDFRPGFAQGLILSRWSRAPVDLDQVARRSPAQVGYRSTGENGALRGVYLEGAGGPWRIVALGSSARLDAARDTSGRVERLEESGLHVTALEKSRADALRETALGLRVERALAGRLRLGATALRSAFDPPFAPKEAGLSGAVASVVGLDGRASIGGLTVAGEVARAARGARAWVAGVALRGPRLRAGVQARDYGSRFQALHGAGFSTFGESRNERGIFAGLAYKGRRLRAAALAFDRAWRPAPTSTLPAGSARSSLTLRVEHRLLRSTLVQWSGRARWDRTWKGKEKGVLPRRRQGLRMDVAQHLGRGLQFHGRGEVVRTALAGDREVGGSAFGGLEIRRRGFRLESRLTCFDIPSYESRIFEWETAPEGMMALRTLTGRGFKGYALISVKVGPVRPTCRLWRQWPTDGRKATTEIVAQVDVKM